jgi:hypothetical protein
MVHERCSEYEFCEILRAMELLTAEGAEKSRRGRREEHDNSFPLRSLRLFFAVSAVKGFSDGLDFTRRGFPWHATLKY